MIIIGITGPIGHGKSTFAKTLLAREKKSEHLESSTIISEIANQWLDYLPDDLIHSPQDRKMLNLWLAGLSTVVNEQLRAVSLRDLEISEEDIASHPESYDKLFMFLDLIKQDMVKPGIAITEDNKDRYRSLLQWLGGYLVIKIGKGIWYDEIERRIKLAEKTGTRLFVVGGLRFIYDAEVIKRNGGIVAQVIRKGLISRDSSDFTESERTKIHVDINIISDAGVDALVEASNAIYDDVTRKNYLPEYRTSDFSF